MIEKDTMPAPAVDQAADTTTQRKGLTFERYFTKPGIHPFDEIEWEFRTAVISNEKGEKIFEQKDVEIPKFWSMTATNVVVSKFYQLIRIAKELERNVKQLVERVAR